VFCPECGTEERQFNQFCRACGIDLRRIRTAVDTPDSVTASATSAREEIGRAVAAKIKETQNVYELKKVADSVLPEIEKFLESPAEKRLRRIRVGTTISSIGLGAAIAMATLAAIAGKEEFEMLAGFGFITIFIGLGFIINGYFLTVTKTSMSNLLDADARNSITGIEATRDFELPEPSRSFASVTEHTTKHLKDDLSVSNK